MLKTGSKERSSRVQEATGQKNEARLGLVEPEAFRHQLTIQNDTGTERPVIKCTTQHKCVWFYTIIYHVFTILFCEQCQKQKKGKKSITAFYTLSLFSDRALLGFSEMMIEIVKTSHNNVFESCKMLLCWSNITYNKPDILNMFLWGRCFWHVCSMCEKKHVIMTHLQWVHVNISRAVCWKGAFWPHFGQQWSPSVCSFTSIVNTSLLQ